MEKKVSDRSDYTVSTIIALIIPIVGFIMGAIFLTKTERIDKKFGEHLIVTAIMGIILTFLILLVIL